MSDYKPKLPNNLLWIFAREMPTGVAYIGIGPRSGFQVISAVEVVERNEGVVEVPHFHVSTCYGSDPQMRRTCTDEEMERVRADFSMGGAEEDNHGPGIVRHLWLECGKSRQSDCACKTDEPRIKAVQRAEEAEAACRVMARMLGKEEQR